MPCIPTSDHPLHAGVSQGKALDMEEWEGNTIHRIYCVAAYLTRPYMAGCCSCVPLALPCSYIPHILSNNCGCKHHEKETKYLIMYYRRQNMDMQSFIGIDHMIKVFVKRALPLSLSTHTNMQSVWLGKLTPVTIRYPLSNN